MQVFLRAGHHVELFATPGPNRAGELARRAIKQGCDLILAAGGDGTINEAINGMAGSDVPFGALPAGTANVLANEVGLSNRPDRAAAELLEAVPTRIALGALDRPGFSRRHFVLMAGVGLDARIVYDLDLHLKWKLGKIAYWQGGFRQFGRPVAHFPIEVNGHKHIASFALITRVRNYGGDFQIAKRIKLTDGDFEIVDLREPGLARLPAVLRGGGGESPLQDARRDRVSRERSSRGICGQRPRLRSDRWGGDRQCSRAHLDHPGRADAPDSEALR